MGDSVELVAEGRVQAGVPVAVDIAPQAADAIDVLATMDIDQRAPLCPIDDQGFVLRHLSKGVPDKLTIPALKFVA